MWGHLTGSRHIFEEPPSTHYVTEPSGDVSSGQTCRVCSDFHWVSCLPVGSLQWFLGAPMTLDLQSHIFQSHFPLPVCYSAPRPFSLRWFLERQVSAGHCAHKLSWGGGTQRQVLENHWDENIVSHLKLVVTRTKWGSVNVLLSLFLFLLSILLIVFLLLSCSPGWPSTHYVTEDDVELLILFLTSTSRVPRAGVSHHTPALFETGIQSPDHAF